MTDINLITADVESNTASSLSSAAASASFASLPKLTGLSAGQEPSEPSVDGEKWNISYSKVENKPEKFL